MGPLLCRAPTAAVCFAPSVAPGLPAGSQPLARTGDSILTRVTHTFVFFPDKPNATTSNLSKLFVRNYLVPTRFNGLAMADGVIVVLTHGN